MQRKPNHLFTQKASILTTSLSDTLTSHGVVPLFRLLFTFVTLRCTSCPLRMPRNSLERTLTQILPLTLSQNPTPPGSNSGERILSKHRYSSNPNPDPKPTPKPNPKPSWHTQDRPGPHPVRAQMVALEHNSRGAQARP